MASYSVLPGVVVVTVSVVVSAAVVVVVLLVVVVDEVVLFVDVVLLVAVSGMSFYTASGRKNEPYAAYVKKRFFRLSSKNNCISGLTIFKTTPGKPAPVPMSSTFAF